MIKNILVPVGDANLHDNHVPYAVHLANEFKAKLTLLRTYPLYQGQGAVAVGGFEAVSASGLADHVVERDEIQETTEATLKEIPGVNELDYELLVEPGEAHLIISSQIKEIQPDLLIVNSERAVGLEGLFGLEAEVLSRKVPCSTLIIPNGFVYAPIKKVALALDKGKAKDEVVLDDLIKFIEHYDTSLDAIHISEESQENYNDISQDQFEIYNSLAIRLEHKDVTNFNLLTKVENDITKGLKEFIRRKSINLLVLIYRDHGFFKRIFNPGIRKQMIQEAGIPTLILK